DSPGNGENVGGPVAVVGWAVDLDAASGTGVERVLVFLDGDQSQGTALGPAQYGIERPDVVAALQNPRFLNSGFEFQVDPAAVPPGAHRLVFYAVAPDGTMLPSELALTLAPPAPAAPAQPASQPAAPAQPAQPMPV